MRSMKGQRNHGRERKKELTSRQREAEKAKKERLYVSERSMSGEDRNNEQKVSSKTVKRGGKREKRV